MKYNNFSNRRTPFVFKRFGRKGYSLFNCLGKEVIVGTLSIATLTYAKAEGVAVEPLRTDTISTETDKELMLDEVSITGSRAPLAKSQAARMVTVLEKSDIQAAPVQSVNDLLKYVAGVDVRQRGPIGAQTDVSIRGGNYEQVTILLNGINICDPQTGHNAFDFPVDISEIERIEVLEGAAGRVFGTSSLTGAINIVTALPHSSSADVHLESGSFGYASAGGRANLAKGKWNNQLSAGYTRSDGYSRSKDNALNADYEGMKAFYQGTFQSNALRLRWHAGVSSKDYGSNTFYGVKWDEQFEHTLKTYTALQGEMVFAGVHIKPAVYWNHHEDRFELYRDREEKSPFNYHRSEVYGACLNTYFDWWAGRTAIGGELRREELKSTTLGEPLDAPHHINGTDRYYLYGINRTQINWMLEHNIVLKRLTISAGIVAAKNTWSNGPMKVYPGVDMSYRLSPHWSIYASWNNSLRVPSATELYYSVGGHKADKYLKAEELQSTEGGIKYAGNVVRASANVYYHHGKNMIDWIRKVEDGPDAPWQSVNFTKLNTIGVEVRGEVSLRQLWCRQQVLRQFSVAYHYIDQDKDDVTGIESKYVLEYLRHKVVASLHTNPWKHLYLDVDYRFQERTGTYTDINGATCHYTPYGVVDARMEWKEPCYSIYAEVNNLFDKTYVDYGNVTQPGTWLIAGLRLHLK
ncbi:MAG: TonB-dependent receptor plug domain-containing protein [Prevotella sp.]